MKRQIPFVGNWVNTHKVFSKNKKMAVIKWVHKYISSNSSKTDTCFSSYWAPSHDEGYSTLIKPSTEDRSKPDQQVKNRHKTTLILGKHLKCPQKGKLFICMINLLPIWTLKEINSIVLVSLTIVGGQCQGQILANEITLQRIGTASSPPHWLCPPWCVFLFRLSRPATQPG